MDIDRGLFGLPEDLDAAFFVTGFARYARFVALADFAHSSSSKGGTIPPGVPAEGRLRQTSGTLAAGWRAVSEPEGTLDLLAGARLWSIRGAAEVPAMGVSRSRSLEFVDPVVALRANVALAPRW